MITNCFNEIISLPTVSGKDEKPEILSENKFNDSNLLVKTEMAKELHCMGLPVKAIGRILHLKEEVMRQYVEGHKIVRETRQEEE